MAFKSMTNLGACVIQMDDDYEKAIPYFQRVIDTAPDNENIAIAYHNIGFLEMKHGDPMKAQQLIEKSYSLFPDYPETLYTLGVLYDGFTIGKYKLTPEYLKLKSHEIFAKESNKTIKELSTFPKASLKTIPGVDVYEIKNAMMMCGKIQTDDHIVVTHHRKQIPVHRWAFGNAIKVKCAISCLQYNSWGYYHWIIETMPRLTIAMQNKLPILLPDKPFVKEFVQKYFPTVNAAFLKPGISLMIDTLYVYDWPAVSRYRCYGNYEFLVPRKVLRYAVGKLNLTFPKTQRKVVWLSRKNVKCRRCLNDDDVVSAIEAALPSEYELVVLTPEDYDLDSTVKLLSETAILIGIHGGALSNMIFCKRGTFIVEIGMKEIFYYSYFKDLADTLGLRHVRIVHDEPNMFNKDITVDASPVASITSKIARAHMLLEDIFEKCNPDISDNDEVAKAP
jgi:capsular polysaccharide biosynthesis protein